jgi:hypothetical protein
VALSSLIFVGKFVSSYRKQVAQRKRNIAVKERILKTMNPDNSLGRKVLLENMAGIKAEIAELEVS